MKEYMIKRDKRIYIYIIKNIIKSFTKKLHKNFKTYIKRKKEGITFKKTSFLILKINIKSSIIIIF